MLLYQKLAETLAESIRNKVYRAGDKLPSLRQQAKAHNVSIATVQEAYHRLETWGMIEARPQSGFYVKSLIFSEEQETPSVAELAPSPAEVSISQMATKLFQFSQKQGVVNLGTAYPHSSFLPLKQLKRIVGDISRHHIDAMTRAHFAPGDAYLRRQIARRMNEAQTNVTAEDIVLTNGCQEALSLSLRAVAEPGDTIAIESPTFVGILQAIEALGLKAVEIPTHPQEGISIEALELALEQWPIKAVVVIPTYNNPSGSCMPLENRLALINLLSSKQIALIEDALFEDLSHNGELIPSCAALSDYERIVYCSSVSKSLAPGVRIGWVAPRVYQEKIEFLKSFLSVGCSSVDSMITTKFMESTAYARHKRHLQHSYAHQVNVFAAEISDSFPQGTSLSLPRGGYILWIALPRHLNAWIFYQRALEKNVCVIPGQLFSITKKFNHYFRINCAQPWNDESRQAIRQLGMIAHQMADEFA